MFRKWVICLFSLPFFISFQIDSFLLSLHVIFWFPSKPRACLLSHLNCFTSFFGNDTCLQFCYKQIWMQLASDVFDQNMESPWFLPCRFLYYHKLSFFSSCVASVLFTWQISTLNNSRFSSDDVSAQNQVKASVQRKIRQSIADEYPGLELVLEDLLPKKSPLIVVKW